MWILRKRRNLNKFIFIIKNIIEHCVLNKLCSKYPGRNKYWTKGLILGILLLVSWSNSSGQFITTGNAPWFTKYQQINTPHFKIIFPEKLDTTANNLAHLLEFNYKNTLSPYSIYPNKIPVIIHNQSVLSNGYVTWAPKRM